MSKLQPPAISRQSTQAVTDTTIAGTSPTVIAQDDTLQPSPLNISGSIDYDDELQGMLSDLVRQDPSEFSPPSSFMKENIFPKADVDEQTYITKFIDIDKTQIDGKLKQVFILSLSGKPIYSMNGTDEQILGYSGLITTIVSLFEHNTQEQVRCMDYGDVMITIVNKNPLIFVSITKIKYEMIMDQNTNDNVILLNQLNVLYEYLVLILSVPTITRLFHNRMNYDLRKSLTPLDFKNMDDLCMKLTYGLSDDYKQGLDHYLSALLDNSRQSCIITNSTRSKLNSFLLHLRLEDSLDVLFGLFAIEDRIVSMMKPKTHTLSNKDLKMLMLIISNNQHSNIKEDLWIPICMPNFNSNGFLYCFVRNFDLSKYLKVDGKFYDPLDVNVILISTNKNSFYNMQQAANKVIDLMIENEIFRNKLYEELTTRDKLVNVPAVEHYIFKDKRYNQFISSQLTLDNRNLLFKYIHHYTYLYNSKTTTIKSLTNNTGDKKLTYLKFNSSVGFMLSDENYEFYCISSQTKLSSLIQDTLGIIKWYRKYHKRIGNNVIEFLF